MRGVTGLLVSLTACNQITFSGWTNGDRYLENSIFFNGIYFTIQCTVTQYHSIETDPIKKLLLKFRTKTRRKLGLVRNEFSTLTVGTTKTLIHDDVIKWKHFPRYWPFERGIHQSPVNSPHKGQWRGALMLSLICAWINGWVNNRKAGDLRRHRAHYGVTVMETSNYISWRNAFEIQMISYLQHISENYDWRSWVLVIIPRPGN